jgi:hypothetical protein
MNCEEPRQKPSEQPAPVQEPARVVLDVQAEKPEVPMLVLATRRELRGEQHQFRFAQAARAEIQLAPGTYYVQAIAAQHAPSEKFLMSLHAGSTTTQKVALRSECQPAPPSFEERLRAYGLNSKQAADKLELKPREHRCAQNEEAPGVARLQAKSLEQVKRFIGSPAGVFQDEEPKLGAVEISEETVARLRERKLTADDRIALHKLANEYLHGNEKANPRALAQVGPILGTLVHSDFWFHLYRVLTIPAGATYEFGPGTLVLDQLNIHKTGRLVAKGQCKFDIGQWVEFT